MKYLASPFTDKSKNVEFNRYLENLDYVRLHLKRTGEKIFSPIVYGYNLTNINFMSDIPTHFEYWQDFNFDMLSLASELIVLKLDGWQESKGVQAEIKFAKELGIKITYVKQ